MSQKRERLLSVGHSASLPLEKSITTDPSETFRASFRQEIEKV